MREMKDSGVEWVGEIPAGWMLKRVKYLASSNIDALSETTDANMPLNYVDIGSVTYLNGIEQIQQFYFKNAPSRARRLVSTGDTIISTVRTYLKAIAYIDSCYKDIVVSTGFSVLHPRESVIPKYMYYALSADFFVSSVEAHSAGISYPAITNTALINLNVVLPPKEMQYRIADYLDTKCAQIDAIIARQQEIIEKLKAYKLSVITEAVTKGLNPDVPMKDSGVEWIGKIPTHWAVIRFKNVIKAVSSGISAITGDDGVECGKYILRTSAVSSGYFRPDEVKSVTKDAESRLICPVTQGSVIISRMNTANMVGAAAYVDQDYQNLYVPDKLWQVSFINEIDSEHAWYLLNSAPIQNWFGCVATGASSSMQNIALDDFYDTVFPLPPLEEQENIIAHLNRVATSIHGTLVKHQELVTKLTEYKKSLIYEVVTGKKEV